MKKDIMWRIYFSFFFICLFGVAIVVQIFRIQFVQGTYWKQKADSLTTDYRDIEASRGNITSDDGSILATSVPIYDIRMDMNADGLPEEFFNDQVDSLARCLSDLFKDRSKSEYKHDLRQARQEGDRYFLVRRNVHFPELQKVKQFPILRLGRYRGGMIVETRSVRENPFRSLAARTIGYQRAVKPVGIEAAFNKELKGVSGQRLEQKISGGIWIPINDKDEIEPKDGNDIITTLDVNIQDVAEHALEEHLRKHNADHGCAVLMEVATGEIKAIANLSRNSEGNYLEDFNYVIAEATEPGSTMKMASLLAAMDDGLVSPEDSIYVGNGEYSYYNQPMKDSHAPKATKLSVAQAFETSSNVGISKVIFNAYNKTPQKFINHLKKFHLDKSLGLQIEGEGEPRIKDVKDKDWSLVSLPWISIGYEVKLTPLQILTFYNAIANNGKMVQPKFVKEEQYHGKTVETFSTQVISDTIASPAAIAKAKKLLEGVVQKGTASSLSKSCYRIAGKTGTAQMFGNQFGYDKNHMSYQASFVGYFPADNPKYSCMVVVYAPSNDMYFGGAVAAPVFREISDKVYSTRMELHDTMPVTDSLVKSVPLAKSGSQKELNKVLAQLNVNVISPNADAAWVSTSPSANSVRLSERKIISGLMPDVSGMGAKDALNVLENAGLRVKMNGKGIVSRQSVEAGTKIQKGQQITVDLN
ncbi:MAG: penicillin-binding protein [Bacteroidetes bacterium]|nr:penicillin-binding protein [Bacteroidota bacterium]